MKTLKYAVLVALAMLLTGCAGTKPQQVAFISTDALGKVVAEARDRYADYKAQEAWKQMGSSATKQSVIKWIEHDPDWIQFESMYATYQAAYATWCNANAALAAGTNAATALANPQFRADALRAAAQLTTFVARFIADVQPIKPPE